MSDAIQLFNAAPKLVIHENACNIELSVMQVVPGGGFIEAVTLHNAMCYGPNALPPEVVIGELNYKLAQRVSKIYHEWLRRNPYHV